MLNFRRTAAAPRTEPAVSKPASQAGVEIPGKGIPSNAEKARALIEMLESGGDGAGVPPERLRDWARDLVETVERGVSGPRADFRGEDQASISKPFVSPVGASPVTGPSANSLPRPYAVIHADSAGLTPTPRKPLVDAVMPARLFSSAAPVLRERAPAGTPFDAPHSPAQNRIAASGRLNLAAPIAHEAEANVVNSRGPIRIGLAPTEVRRLVAETVDPQTLSREHPAIVAMTLAGKPSLEQAAALRRLPSGQIRAVHRALRQLELGLA